MAAHFPTPTWRSLVAWTVIEYVTKEICRSDPSFGTNLYKTHAHHSCKGDKFVQLPNAEVPCCIPVPLVDPLFNTLRASCLIQKCLIPRGHSRHVSAWTAANGCVDEPRFWAELLPGVRGALCRRDAQSSFDLGRNAIRGSQAVRGPPKGSVQAPEITLFPGRHTTTINHATIRDCYPNG